MPGRTKGRPRTDLVAIVDLGSAAVRFIIARIRPSARYDVVVEERVPTRLGGGAPGTLPARAITKTLRAVHRFFARYSPQRREGPRVVAIATSAVRDALNRERLLDPLRRDEGIEVRILSARDEARLGGILATVAPADKRIIHGMSDAIMAPCRVADDGY